MSQIHAADHARSLASLRPPSSDLCLPFGQAVDGLFAGVVGRARGALGRMRRTERRHAGDAHVALRSSAPETVERLIARARVVADGRAALVAPEVGTACDCPDCGASIGRARFCPECGRGVALVRSCRMCEAELPGASRFCLECGAQA